MERGYRRIIMPRTLAVQIDFKMPDMAKKFRGKRDEIYRFIAAQMQTNRGMLFDKEGAYNGHPKWEGLKFRVGQILSSRGTLRKSLSPPNPRGRPGPDGIARYTGDTITIGTSLMFAELMNDGTAKLPGGVLRARNAKALAIPLPAGKRATDLAKELRKKESVGRKDLQKKVIALRGHYRKTKSSKQKKLIMERLLRYEKRMKNMGKTQRVIFRKSVKIPARPFNIWNDQDHHELEAALTNKIAEVLNG